MNINDKIKESIKFYNKDSNNCKLMKILMEPINYLGYLKKTNKTNKYNANLGNFLLGLGQTQNDILKFNEIFETNNDYHEEFIKDIDSLYQYLCHIQNIFIQSYINYYDKNASFPKKLYRSVYKEELDYLKNAKQIKAIWSTSSTLEASQGYTMELADSEWNPKEHFILELSLKNRIPFIDVDKLKCRVFEPNEFILTSPFTVSKIQLIKKGGISQLGFYTPDSIPIYSAELKYTESENLNCSFEDILKQINIVKQDFELYRDLIENYLNSKSEEKLLHQSDYRNWVHKLQELISMIQSYSSYYAKVYLNAPEEANKLMILK